jgi:hypothetical protein
MRTINVFIIKNTSTENLDSTLQKVKNFFAKKNVSVFFDTRDMNAGYHIYMWISRGTTVGGWSSATLPKWSERKPHGYYRIGFITGALEAGGLNYGDSYEQVIIHEILHCMFAEAYPEKPDIHDWNFGRRDNEQVFDMCLSREVNHAVKSIVHHTASVGSKWQYDAVRQYHVNKGWGDIGYDWFIEKDGAIKIGRWWFREGAHTINHNRTSYGICLAGNFEIEVPTQSQIKNLKALLLTIKLPVFGHREFSSTKCPGKYLFRRWN